MTPPPPPSSTSAASADAPPASDVEPKRISLNVRTLDHATYPISIGSNASVQQLKELVALETGVVFARQRLIFRGRVLKNDQNIAAYALEDGHTLHLVARAADSAEPTTTNGSSSNASSNPAAAAPAPRNNDEPDPTLGGGGASPQVVVGLQDGATVNMPFLTHMIANIMTSAHGAIPSGHIVISDVDLTRDGASSYAHFVRPASAPVVGAATAGGSTAAARREEARARRRSELRAFGGSTGSARTRSGAASTAGGGNMTSGLSNLRARSEQLLETVRSNVENAEYNISGLEETQLEATNETDAAFLQAQLTQLEILLEHFRNRLHLLPVALRELQQRSGNPGAQSQPQPQPSVSAIVRTIDTLQNVGESVDILARLARYLFIRHNPGFTGGNIRLNDGDSVSVTSGPGGGGTGVSVNTATSSGATSASSANTGAAAAASAGGGAAAAASAAPAIDARDSDRRTTSERRASSHRRRANARLDASRGSGDNTRSGNALFSLLERMNESIRGATAGLTGSSSGTTSPTPLQSSTEAPSSSSLPAAASIGQPPQLSMANLGLPLGSMVFPISFTDLNANSTTWNFAELVNRVASEVPTSTLFNVVSGEPVAIHQVMAQIGYALVSGTDVPPVSRATIRTWSHSFTTELRQQLRSRGVPVEVLSHIEASRQPRFVDNLIRPLEPFVPDLVDFFLRATSASRTAAFGSSSIDFLSTMSRQFVRHMRTYVGGDGETLRSVLQSLAEYFGLDTRLASFAVANFLDWADSRRRELDSSSGSAESGPANKRRRED